MCSSCAAKQQAQTNRNLLPRAPIVQGECTYTREELQDKLLTALSQQNWSQVSFLKSALGRYDVNCNEYNEFIL